MPQPRPELIIVSGPMAGQRAVLMDNVALLGRSGECDVQINEPTVSRKQIKFKLAPGGWVVENIAATPIRIDGKKYKMGEKIFVETGDVIGVGSDTRILFVSSDADPEQALLQYQQANPIAPPPAEPPDLQESAAAPTMPIPPAPPTAPLAAEPTAEPDDVEPTALEPAEESGPLSAEDLLAQQRNAKLKKYGILFGIYFVVLVVGVVLISQLIEPAADDREPPGLPGELTKAKITEVLSRRIDPLGDFPARAQEHLAQARRLYVERQVIPKRYLCIQHYKLYLAYGGLSGGGTFSIDDERSYEQTLNELIENVYEHYDNGYILRQEYDWDRAKRQFEIVQAMVPAPQGPEPNPQENEIFTNAQANINYINRQLRERD